MKVTARRSFRQIPLIGGAARTFRSDSTEGRAVGPGSRGTWPMRSDGRRTISLPNTRLALACQPSTGCARPPERHRGSVRDCRLANDLGQRSSQRESCRARRQAARTPSRLRGAVRHPPHAPGQRPPAQRNPTSPQQGTQLHFQCGVYPYGRSESSARPCRPAPPAVYKSTPHQGVPLCAGVVALRISSRIGEP